MEKGQETDSWKCSACLQILNQVMLDAQLGSHDYLDGGVGDQLEKTSARSANQSRG